MGSHGNCSTEYVVYPCTAPLFLHSVPTEITITSFLVYQNNSARLVYTRIINRNYIVKSVRRLHAIKYTYSGNYIMWVRFQLPTADRRHTRDRYLHGCLHINENYKYSSVYYIQSNNNDCVSTIFKWQ